MPHNYPHITHGKLYIFGKVRSSSFQKYIDFHSYYKDIHLAVVKTFPIFRKFPSTLVPFSLIQNHITIYTLLQKKCTLILPCSTGDPGSLTPTPGHVGNAIFQIRTVVLRLFINFNSAHFDMWTIFVCWIVIEILCLIGECQWKPIYRERCTSLDR